MCSSRTVRFSQLLEKSAPCRQRFLRLGTQTIVYLRFSFGAGWKRGQSEQRVVQLFGVTYIRPGVLAHFGDGNGIEPANFSQHRIGQDAAHLDSTSAALFKWRIVEIGVGIGVQDLVRKLRWHPMVDRKAPTTPIFLAAPPPIYPLH